MNALLIRFANGTVTKSNQIRPVYNHKQPTKARSICVCVFKTAAINVSNGPRIDRQQQRIADDGARTFRSHTRRSTSLPLLRCVQRTVQRLRLTSTQPTYASTHMLYDALNKYTHSRRALFGRRPAPCIYKVVNSFAPTLATCSRLFSPSIPLDSFWLSHSDSLHVDAPRCSRDGRPKIDPIGCYGERATQRQRAMLRCKGGGTFVMRYVWHKNNICIYVLYSVARTLF